MNPKPKKLTDELNLVHPAEVLKSFYQGRGVAEDDLQGKFEALQPLIVVPNLKTKPTLYQLEQQYLIEQGLRSFE
ncbi:hypothetical protein ACFLZB_03080 [Nanoarchaeota archaeon]